MHTFITLYPCIVIYHLCVHSKTQAAGKKDTRRTQEVDKKVNMNDWEVKPKKHTPHPL